MELVTFTHALWRSKYATGVRAPLWKQHVLRGACSSLSGEDIYLHCDASELCVQRGQRCAGDAARRELAALLRLVQLDLQVPDVVDDVLQDLHFARLLVRGQRGHQLLQFAVAVVHVLQDETLICSSTAAGSCTWRWSSSARTGSTSHVLSADLALQGAGRSDNLHLDASKFPRIVMQK